MASSPVVALRAVGRSLDRRVAATPAGRDRTVDLMRAVSIAVVVIWHWAGSVTHRRDGEIVMPNPIDQVPSVRQQPLILLHGHEQVLVEPQPSQAVRPDGSLGVIRLIIDHKKALDVLSGARTIGPLVRK